MCARRKRRCCTCNVLMHNRNHHRASRRRISRWNVITSIGTATVTPLRKYANRQWVLHRKTSFSSIFNIISFSVSFNFASHALASLVAWKSWYLFARCFFKNLCVDGNIKYFRCFSTSLAYFSFSSFRSVAHIRNYSYTRTYFCRSEKAYL